jgi:ankyrin repeat protein
LYSLKSFVTNDNGEIAKQSMNPLMSLENEFMKSLNTNVDEQSENEGTSLKYDLFETIARFVCSTHLKRFNRLKKLPALHMSCTVGNVEYLKKLLDKEHCDPNQADANGFFPLHYAVINNRRECVKLLLNIYRCLPNVVDNRSMSPLHYAAQLGYVEIVKMLINHPDIDLVR